MIDYSLTADESISQMDNPHRIVSLENINICMEFYILGSRAFALQFGISNCTVAIAFNERGNLTQQKVND